MSYSHPYDRDDRYQQFRQVTARKEWPCAYAAEKLCDGTIRPGEPYVDEVLMPWTPETDGDVDDEGRAIYTQTGTIGAFQHTRYHLACERRVVERMLDAEFGLTAAEAAAEDARHAQELAERDRDEKAARAARKARQQWNSRKARRQREIEAHAARTGPVTR